MDQIQTQDRLDPEVAQEVITLLSKKIANLRAENAQLQSQLSGASVKTEGTDHKAPDDDTRRLLEEAERWRSELERRPSPEEVAMLEEKLKKSKRRNQESKQNLQSQVEQLRAELKETESARQKEQAIQEALKEEIRKLCNDLNERTREKDEALAQFESQRPDTFDVRRFLRGELEELPPMPNPVVVTGKGKPQFKGVIIEKRSNKLSLSVSGAGVIKWANKGGGCVVPFPPVIYNGSKHVAERSRGKIIENSSYELFEADGHCMYYGTYRCIKVATMDWSALRSLGQEFADAFLETTVIQDGHAAPVIQSLMKSMYRSSILKADCAVLRCEGFDEAITKETQSADGPPRIRNVPIRNAGKRPNDGYQGGKGSHGASKKPKLRDGSARTRRRHPNLGSR